MKTKLDILLLKLRFTEIYKAIMIERNLIDNFYADFFCVGYFPRAINCGARIDAVGIASDNHEWEISVVYPTLSLIKSFTDLFHEHSVLTSGRVFLKLLIISFLHSN